MSSICGINKIVICIFFEIFFGIALFGIGMKTDLFQSCGHYWAFQICWHVECSTLIALSFGIWNSLAGIPSPPLALFLAMLHKVHLTSHFRMFGSRWMIPHHCSYPSRQELFCIVLMCKFKLPHSCAHFKWFCSVSFKKGISSVWTENLQVYKLILEKAEEPEIKLPAFVGS